MDEKLLTVKEVADILNVKPSTLLYWIENNKLNCPCYRLNGKNSYRFKRSDISKFLIEKEEQ